MTTVKRVCVYCGSSPGARPEYRSAAQQLGRLIVTHKLELVYGGASVGLMGTIADTVMQYGGRVTGVIPGSLKNEVAHEGLSELREVNTMHERKQMMFDLSDAMIAIPGGFGTLEEFFEALTWGQLRFHDKPCALLNTCGYFDRLLEFLDQTVTEGFVRQENRDHIIVADHPEELLKRICSWHSRSARSVNLS